MGTVPERKRTRKAKAPKRYVAVRPVIDKTTTHDTFTRGELMRLREEEVEKFRNAQIKSSKN
jgi:hypothetical protein